MADSQVIYRDFSDNWKRNVLEPAIGSSLQMYAEVIRSNIQENFGTEGGGVIGTTKSGRNIYVGAPVGSFPSIRTGRLRNSIAYRRIEYNEYVIGTNLAYGRYLEYGTGTMRARPWLRRSHRQGHPQALRMFAETMKQKLGL